jgi:predicted porin
MVHISLLGVQPVKAAIVNAYVQGLPCHSKGRQAAVLQDKLCRVVVPVPQKTRKPAESFASDVLFWCNGMQLPATEVGSGALHPQPLYQPWRTFNMKKTLIALAALASTAAFAQSSVTLYGVADASLTKVSGKSAALSSSKTLNNGTSRWGVRGTEDLGGGMKAGFNFEQGVSLEDGSIAKSGGTEFGRAAWMNLSGGFGEVRLGRTLNPSFFAAAAWELTGTANYSAVTSQFNAGGSDVLGGIRNSRQISYTTPNMGGFSATLGYVLKGNNAAEKAKVDLNVIYANGPLAVALGYNKLQDAEKNVHVGAKYNFGAFTLAGGYIDPAGDAKGFAIGGSVPLGPVNLVVDVARDTEAKDTDLLIEVKYPLSKRTVAYGAFLRDGKNKPGALGAAGKDVNGLGLGIRHNF